MNKTSLSITIALHITLFIFLSQAKTPPSLSINRIKLTQTTTPKALKIPKTKQKQVIIPKKIAQAPSRKPPQKAVLQKKPLTRKKILKKIEKRAQAKRSEASKKKSLQKPAKPFLPPSSTQTKKAPLTLSATCIRFLQEALVLPKKGSVKVRISVQTNGKIDTIDVIEGNEDNENARYLQKKLRKLTLPGFASIKKETFTILFSHSKD